MGVQVPEVALAVFEEEVGVAWGAAYCAEVVFHAHDSNETLYVLGLGLV